MSVKLAYSAFGSSIVSKLPPLIILHGIFGQKRNWKTIAERLVTRSQRQVYVLDARNHGDSPHTDRMTYFDMSNDVVTFLSEHYLEQCALLGHSMGGKVAMATALQHPEIVEKLIVVDVSPTRAPGTSQLLDYITVLQELDLSLIKSKLEADQAISKVIANYSVRQFLLTNLVKSAKSGSYEWRVNLSGIAGNLQQVKSFPVFSRPFGKPSLFIGGANSNYITSSDVSEILRGFPQADIQHIPDAGHWVHIDQPERFLHSVATYLSS